jgi:gamma-glutamylcyclotransferase (GGCT)/AIG2-like uncharacterized protein YtfP
MEQDFLVAVYGSLRQGMGNHPLLSRGEATKLSTERVGGFLMYSMGGFPYIRPAPQLNDIVIEVYKVDASTMRRLDQLEGYPSFYNRKLIDTTKGQAWIYFIDEEPGGREPVHSGDWVKFRRGEI